MQVSKIEVLLILIIFYPSFVKNVHHAAVEIVMPFFVRIRRLQYSVSKTVAVMGTPEIVVCMHKSAMSMYDGIQKDIGSDFSKRTLCFTYACVPLFAFHYLLFTAKLT